MALALLLGTGLSTGAGATEIYRTVDESGNVIFTDRPPPNAPGTAPPQPMRLPVPNTMPSPAAALPSTPGEGPTKDDAIPDYALRVLAPENDASLRSNEGLVDVVLAVDPPLIGGHSLQILLDGAPMPDSIVDGLAQLVNVDRGTHELVIRILDDGGAVLRQAPPVVFHLQRVSVRARNFSN